MTHELTPSRTPRFFGDVAHDRVPIWSGTAFKHNLKSAVEIVFIAAIVGWAFVVPLFKDSLIQAVQNLFLVP